MSTALPAPARRTSILACSFAITVIVFIIGIAAIAPLFGVNSLGYPIVIDGLGGFRIESHIIGGVILISALAIVADLLLLGVQWLLSRGRPITAV